HAHRGEIIAVAGQDGHVPHDGAAEELLGHAVIGLAAGGHDLQRKTGHAVSPFFAWATTSSMVPLNRNAASGRPSCLPSRISLKPRMVSFRGTYRPSMPVNCSATVKGWLRKRWILRARLTVILSSSLSSSMPM